jgi:hypothetical protein
VLIGLREPLNERDQLVDLVCDAMVGAPVE